MLFTLWAKRREQLCALARPLQIVLECGDRSVSTLFHIIAGFIGDNDIAFQLYDVKPFSEHGAVIGVNHHHAEYFALRVEDGHYGAQGGDEIAVKRSKFAIIGDIREIGLTSRESQRFLEIDFLRLGLQP